MQQGENPIQLRQQFPAQSVSVVIPTYNRRAAVLRALRSVTEQSRTADEIIVVDDGSEDGTAASIHREFPHVEVITQANRGVSASRNRGLAAASGSWIAFLDSDDEWRPRKIEAQLEALSRAPEYRLCHTDETWIRNDKRVNPMRKHAKHGGWIYRKCLPLCVISPSSVMLARTVFDQIGTFDEALPACEDYDLWLRFCSRSPVLYVPEELVIKYGGHEDQLSRAHWGMDRFRIKALEKILGEESLRREDEIATLEMLCSKIRVYLSGASKRQKPHEVEIYRHKLQHWQGVLYSRST